MPSRDLFQYTFDNVADVIDRFTQSINFTSFAIYVFDYGADWFSVGDEKP